MSNREKTKKEREQRERNVAWLRSLFCSRELSAKYLDNGNHEKSTALSLITLQDILLTRLCEEKGVSVEEMESKHE